MAEQCVTLDRLAIPFINDILPRGSETTQYFFISAGHTDGLFIVMGSDL